MKYDIFISYSRHDSDVVNELVALLEQEGYSIWIDRDGIESGEDFKRVILKAIKESKVVLFFSSEHSNVSDWTAKEIGVTVKYKKHIIPIKLDNSNYNEAVEFDLINLDYIDYSKISIQTAMREKLLKTLRKKLGLGSKEIERLEAERKAKEETERARLERERIAKAEAERKAEEAKRKAEQERLERERAEAQHKVELEKANRLKVSYTPQTKSKLILWIALGAVAVVALILVLAWPNSQSACVSVSGSYNGHNYVDLGLPSGTLWATCNVGANTPEDYGDYFAWGETNPKTTYDWNTYTYCNGSYTQLTKYCNMSNWGYNGHVDNLTVLQSIDDAAMTNWGSGWEMPTKEQWQELEYNTTNTWTIQNGVRGRLFTARNGNNLFLPAFGGRWDGELNVVGSDGNYWSRSLDKDYSYIAWTFYFDSDYYDIYPGLRDGGRSVRAVRSVRQN